MRLVENLPPNATEKANSGKNSSGVDEVGGKSATERDQKGQ